MFGGSSVCNRIILYNISAHALKDFMLSIKMRTTLLVVFDEDEDALCMNIGVRFHR